MGKYFYCHYSLTVLTLLNKYFIYLNSIPRSIVMMNKWLKTICSFQPDFQTTTHTKICSLHFLEADYNLNVVSTPSLSGCMFSSRQHGNPTVLHFQIICLTIETTVYLSTL